MSEIPSATPETVDKVQRIIEDNEEILPGANQMVFKDLKYAWETNLTSKEPKTPENFAKTDRGNAAANRLGKEIHEQSGLGQPGLEILLEENDERLPNEFHVSLYEWNAETATGAPEPVSPVITALSGYEIEEGEKTLEYLDRLVGKGLANTNAQTEGRETRITYAVPLVDLPGVSIRNDLATTKVGERSRIESVTLDLTLPIEDVAAWLTREK